jgi:hypothetical protein
MKNKAQTKKAPKMQKEEIIEEVSEQGNSEEGEMDLDE